MPDWNSTSYTFVPPTIFSVVGGSPSLIRRKDVPYTPLNFEPDKRDLQGRAPDPTPAPDPPVELEPRQAALPYFASRCVGDPNRLSSACTCLIGDILSTPVCVLFNIIEGELLTGLLQTTTIAQPTGPATTITVCGSDLSTVGYSQYGLRDQNYGGGYEFRHNHGQIQSTRYSDIKTLPGCCNKCFHTSRWFVLVQSCSAANFFVIDVYR